MRRTILAITIIILGLVYAVQDKGEIQIINPEVNNVDLTIPKSINFQGYLYLSGTPVTATMDMWFGIYDALVAGSLLYSVTKTGVEVTNGWFTVILDNIPNSIFPVAGPTRYLEVQAPSGGPSLIPRISLVSVGYSYHAVTSDSAEYAKAAPPTGAAGGDLTGTYPNPVIADNAVTSAKIQDGQVQTNDIANLNVTTAKIADGAVTNAKIAANAVTTGKIQDGTILPTDLAFTPVTRPLTPPLSGTEIAKPCTLQASVDDPGSLLILSNPTGVALDITQSGSDGIVIRRTGDEGVYIDTAAGNGIQIDSARYYGVYVQRVGSDGVWVERAADDGFYVSYCRDNGLQVDSCDDIGVYVLKCDTGMMVRKGHTYGMRVDSAGLSAFSVRKGPVQGLWVEEANYAVRASNTSSDGILIHDAGNNGFSVSNCDNSGLHVGTAGQDGVNINQVDQSGVYVNRADRGFTVDHASWAGVYVDSVSNYGLYVRRGYDGVYIDTSSYGLYIDSTRYYGTYVRRSGADGMYISRATDDGITVYRCGDNGVQVDSAGDIGVYVVRCDTGMKVDRGNTYGVRVDSAGTSAFSVNYGNVQGVWVANAGTYGIRVANADNYGVYSSCNAGRGGYFYNNNNDYYTLTAYNGSGTGASIKGLYVRGNGYATGGWSTFLADGKSGFSLTSTDMDIVARGSASLTDGRAMITFDKTYEEAFSKDVPLTVIVTPTSECNGILVIDKSASGFTAKEVLNGKSNATFDWIAIGRIKGYEQRPEIRPITAEQMKQDEQGRLTSEDGKSRYIWSASQTIGTIEEEEKPVLEDIQGSNPTVRPIKAEVKPITEDGTTNQPQLNKKESQTLRPDETENQEMPSTDSR